MWGRAYWAYPYWGPGYWGSIGTGGDSGSNIAKIAIGRDALDVGQMVIGSVMGLSIN